MPREIVVPTSPRTLAVPVVLALVALVGVGWAFGNTLKEKTPGTPAISSFTTTVKGKVVLVGGKSIRIRVPAKTVERNGRTITIPAHTVDLTRTTPGGMTTIDGTVYRTRPGSTITRTGPGGTITVTQTLPGTTLTGPSTTLTETTTVTLPATTTTETVTVTSPPAS